MTAVDQPARWQKSSVSAREEIAPETVERARGDAAAFGEIYDHYLPRVYAFCRRYSTGRVEAEDLTAETFARAFAAIEGYRDRGHPFSAWLLRIAANAAADYGRRSRRLSFLPLSRQEEEWDSHVEEWEHALWLRDHIDALPPDQQEVVRLRFYGDRPFAEIAARMNRSEGAVKQLLRRALQAMHLEIEGEDHA